MTANPKPPRPFGVTSLGIVVLIVAVLNLARGYQALLSWDFLEGLLPVQPCYLVTTGFVWGAVGLATALGLWLGWKWARYSVWLFLGLFSLAYWIERLFLPGYAGRNLNWPFILSMNLLILAWSAWLLSQPKAKKFFEGSDEQRSKSATSA